MELFYADAEFEKMWGRLREQPLQASLSSSVSANWKWVSKEKLLSWYQKAMGIHYAISSQDKEDMKTIFEEYAGVLAGDVEWREIETLPENYLALS